MKSIQSLLSQINTELNNIVGLELYHYEKAQDFELPYAVWAETGEGGAEYANNRKVEQTIEGVLDFYTHTEFDSLIDSIQDRLDTSTSAWSLSSVLYEEETQLIHYHWDWEIT